MKTLFKFLSFIFLAISTPSLKSSDTTNKVTISLCYFDPCIGARFESAGKTRFEYHPFKPTTNKDVILLVANHFKLKPENIEFYVKNKKIVLDNDREFKVHRII